MRCCCSHCLPPFPQSSHRDRSRPSSPPSVHPTLIFLRLSPVPLHTVSLFRLRSVALMFLPSACTGCLSTLIITRIIRRLLANATCTVISSPRSQTHSRAHTGAHRPLIVVSPSTGRHAASLLDAAAHTRRLQTGRGPRRDTGRDSRAGQGRRRRTRHVRHDRATRRMQVRLAIFSDTATLMLVLLHTIPLGVNVHHRRHCAAVVSHG